MQSGSNSLRNRINTRVQEGFRDIELEYQLVGYLARVQPDVCSQVRVEWFSVDMLEDIFEIIDETRAKFTRASLTRELQRRGKGADDDELLDECIKDLFKADVKNLESKGVNLIIAQIMELYDSRRVLIGCGEIVSKLKSFRLGAAKLKLKELSAPIDVINDADEGYYVDDYNKRLAIISEREERAADDEEGSVGIPTGVYRFDRICGGILPKEFGVIAGCTGVGKTAGIINFGLHAWLSGHNTLIVSGEMANADLQFRIDAHLARISGMKFRTATLSDADKKKWGKSVEQYAASSGGNILYTASLSRNFTVDQVESIMLRLLNDTGEKIEWLGLDYLNIMETSKRRPTDGSRDWGSQADVVWDVKNLTQEYDLVTWTANQVKDEAFEKDLFELTDLKYARAISETAPVVVSFVRSDKDILQKRMRLQVLKMRNATEIVKPIVLHPNLDFMLIDVGVGFGKKSLADIGRDNKAKVRAKKHQAPKKTLKEK